MLMMLRLSVTMTAAKPGLCCCCLGWNSKARMMLLILRLLRLFKPGRFPWRQVFRGDTTSTTHLLLWLFGAEGTAGLMLMMLGPLVLTENKAAADARDVRACRRDAANHFRLVFCCLRWAVEGKARLMLMMFGLSVAMSPAKSGWGERLCAANAHDARAFRDDAKQRPN